MQKKMYFLYNIAYFGRKQSADLSRSLIVRFSPQYTFRFVPVTAFQKEACKKPDMHRISGRNKLVIFQTLSTSLISENLLPHTVVIGIIVANASGSVSATNFLILMLSFGVHIVVSVLRS